MTYTERRRLPRPQQFCEEIDFRRCELGDRDSISSLALLPCSSQHPPLWPHTASSSSVFFPGHPSSPVICSCPFKKLIGQKQITALQQVMWGSWGPGGQIREGCKRCGQCQEYQIKLLSMEGVTNMSTPSRKVQELPPVPWGSQSQVYAAQITWGN